MQPDTSNIPLRDIHLPDPVSWWPPALGWWLLLALLILSIVFVFWLIRRRRLFKLRNTSIAELEAIYKTYQEQYDAKRFTQELSVLLRRVSISYYPTTDAAGLTGATWLEFLDSLLSPKHNKSGQKFANGVGEVLIKAPYQHNLKNSDIDAEALYQLSAEWIYSLGPVQPLKTQNPNARHEVAHVSV